MIYIAAPFFNPDQLEAVKTVEQILTRFNLDFFSPRLHGVDVSTLTEAERKSSSRMRDIFVGNIDAMYLSKFMLACIDDKDQGTNFEIGWFHSNWFLWTQKYKCPEIVTWSRAGAKTNLMIQQAVGGHCATLVNLNRFIDWTVNSDEAMNVSWRVCTEKYNHFDLIDLKEG